MNLYVTIYGLAMPGTADIRYVGQTQVPPKARLTDHIRESRLSQDTRKRVWIHSLLQLDLLPELVLLEVCFYDEWKVREKFWVKHYRALQGELLTNDHPGGNGAIAGRQLSAETKLKISRAAEGRKRAPFSEETKRKMSKPKSLETKLKMGAHQKGKSKPALSEATKQKISQGIQAKLRDPEYKKNVSQGLLNYWEEQRKTGVELWLSSST